MAMLIHHVRTRPAPLRRAAAPVSAPLEQLVLDCLAKEPTQRPASALALDRRLAELERADPWGQEQAERWWREHVPQLPASAAGGDQSEGFVSLG